MSFACAGVGCGARTSLPCCSPGCADAGVARYSQGAFGGGQLDAPMCSEGSERLLRGSLLSVWEVWAAMPQLPTLPTKTFGMSDLSGNSLCCARLYPIVPVNSCVAHSGTLRRRRDDDCQHCHCHLHHCATSPRPHPLSGTVRSYSTSIRPEANIPKAQLHQPSSFSSFFSLVFATADQ